MPDDRQQLKLKGNRYPKGKGQEPEERHGTVPRTHLRRACRSSWHLAERFRSKSGRRVRSCIHGGD